MTSRAGLAVFYRDLALSHSLITLPTVVQGALVRLHISETTYFRTSQCFLRMLFVTVARTSSCGHSICYGLVYGNKNAATPYRRTKIYVARMSRGSSSYR